MSDITLPEMIIEARRELAMRKRVYPRWVELGKIKLDHALRQIQVMEAIATYLSSASESQK